jgi:hypothetical protein
MAPSTLNKFKQNRSTPEKKEGKCRVFANGRWAILPCLLLTDSLISQIFHHTQPIGTFDKRVFGHFPAAFQYIL